MKYHLGGRTHSSAWIAVFVGSLTSLYLHNVCPSSTPPLELLLTCHILGRFMYTRLYFSHFTFYMENPSEYGSKRGIALGFHVTLGFKWSVYPREEGEREKKKLSGNSYTREMITWATLRFSPVCRKILLPLHFLTCKNYIDILYECRTAVAHINEFFLISLDVQTAYCELLVVQVEKIPPDRLCFHGGQLQRDQRLNRSNKTFIPDTVFNREGN